MKFTNSKKGGPYSKEQRDKRQNEVYRLHFEYGYSSRKISEMMKVNRNTIRRDLDYWYTKILQSQKDTYDPSVAICIFLERLDVQRTRLREQLDKVKLVQEKMSIERMICEIDGKILHTLNRMVDSTRRLNEHGIKRINEYLKENHSTTRFLTFDSEISVTPKAYEKIQKIIEQDKVTPPRHI